MPTVTKAIIPVAGLGTRVLPASKAIPKEMLPIVDKPIIQYVVEEAVDAGIKQIILVTRSGKEAIENHFDSNIELESLLSKKGSTEIFEQVTHIVPSDVEIVSVRQDTPRGLGHAVLCGQHICGNDAFAVMLPDVLVFSENGSGTLAKMVQLHAQTGAGQIMVESVPKDQVHLYGIVGCSDPGLKAGQSAAIDRFVEKPSSDSAPSNLAIVGRYVLPARTMHILKSTAPGVGEEIQLTDALEELLLSKEPLQAYRMAGTTFDCGNKLGYLLANLHVGLRHRDTAAGLQQEIRALLDRL